MSIQKFKDKYNNERVFIIGNGPSIDETPLDYLSDEYTFATNKITKKYSETNWRPTFYVLLTDDIDTPHLLIQENINSGVDCITIPYYKERLPKHERIHYVDKVMLKSRSLEMDIDFHSLSKEDVEKMDISELYNYWPNDISDAVYTYHTLYAIIQLAIYMGFDEIYLVGCDLGYDTFDPHMIFEDGLNPHGYKKGKKQFIKESYRKSVFLKSIANGIVFNILTSSLADTAGKIMQRINEMESTNHFGSNYRLTPTDLSYVNDELEKSHITAKRIALDKGIKIYNATIGGELEVYPRVSFKDSIQNGAKRHQE